MAFAGLTILALHAASVNADIVLTNPGFEDDIVSSDTWVYQANGWTVTGDAGTFNPPAAAYPDGAPSGRNVGFVQSGWGRPTGILEQTTGVILEAGMLCEIQAAIGRRVDNPLLPWGGYIMSLWAGDSLLIEDVTLVHPDAGAFTPATLSYVVEVGEEGVGQLLRIRFEALYGQTNIDEVRLTVVPAPCAAMVGGIAVLAAYRRRRTAAE